jgi:hypothetical protein
MATVNDIKLRNYCDVINNELSVMKKRIDALREDLERTYGAESSVYDLHSRHLGELGEFIDWKLQILMKVCPFDWKGRDKDVETTVSVSSPDKSTGPEISGGYLGG